MVCDGQMRRRSMAPTRRSTTGSFAGFDRIFANLAAESGTPDRVMVDSTHLKAHRTAASLVKKGDSPCLIPRTKGGLNSKLHVVCEWRRTANYLSSYRRTNE